MIKDKMNPHELEAMVRELEAMIVRLQRALSELPKPIAELQRRVARLTADMDFVYREHGWIGTGDGGPEGPPREAGHD